jgi:Fe-S cluster assembly protein SufD
MSAQITARRNLYVAEFERNSRSLLGFSALRRKAIDRFASLGFPTPREEAWRFTDVGPIAEVPFRPAGGTANPAQFSGLAKGALKACQIAFVDGRYAPSFTSLDLPTGVRVSSLSAVLRDDPKRLEPWLARGASFEAGPFAALNTAFMSEGAYIFIPHGTVLETPIHLLFLSSLHGEPYVTYPRLLVVAEEDTRVSLVTSFLGPAGGSYFTNAVTEIFLGEHAVLDLTKVQRESHEAFHFETLQVREGRGASFTHHSISLGGRLARNDFGVSLEGEGADCSLFGLYEVAGPQHVDHHTTIDHLKPRGTSRELYKGVLDGLARAVFDGRILVRRDAQKTSAYQTNKNLLLSKDALVNTKPQLEIFANDVKCKHGATIGQLDEAMLFYMRSRGIGLAEARRLLIHAFASEIIDTVKVPAVRTQIGGCRALIAGGP